MSIAPRPGDTTPQARRAPYRSRKITPYRRRIVFTRDDFTCRLCGFRPQLIPVDYDGRLTVAGTRTDGRRVWLELDHVIPHAHGGRGHVDNLQTLCNICNCRKGARV